MVAETSKELGLKTDLSSESEWLLTRKGVLAVAAVVDIALNARAGPVTAKALAVRNHLPPRYIEALLQTLAREGILVGKPGQRGGYTLARDPHRVTAADILRVVIAIDDGAPVAGSLPLNQAVTPALAQVENVFSKMLSGISVEDLTRSARIKAAVWFRGCVS